MSQDDLFRGAAKLMGYSRSGAIVVALFEAAIGYAAEKNRIRQGTNGNWILTEYKN